MTGTRVIYRSQLASSREVQDLLQMVFVAEVVSPSRCLWLVSPYISDIPVIDNRAGDFAELMPDWSLGLITLSEVLASAATRGSAVVVATLGGESTYFVENLRRALPEEAQPHIKLLNEETDLHEKGLVGDDLHIAGSMNFTNRGVTLNQELVTVFSRADLVASARLAFYERYGGRL